MINQQQARELVYEEINKPNPYWPDMPEMIILDEYTIEKEYGWVFYWTSRPWRETGDFKHALAGNGPIIISREDGAIYKCGTSAPLEDRIREQEERLKRDLTKKDHFFAHRVWPELRDLLSQSPPCALILPVGSTEAHGPHLPLSADVIIAEEMAMRAARTLASRGESALTLPPLAYSVTDFSEGFTGSVSIRAETATALVGDILLSLIKQGFKRIAIANAHLEPAHIATLRAACESVKAETGVEVAFPDVTRRRWARMLTEEFQSGACHAGQYESSLVLSARPELVREEIRLALEPKLISLSQAIRAGARSFIEIGGDQAYFGNPAAATAEEGDRVFDILAGMIVTALDEISGVSQSGKTTEQTESF